MAIFPRVGENYEIEFSNFIKSYKICARECLYATQYARAYFITVDNNRSVIGRPINRAIYILHSLSLRFPLSCFSTLSRIIIPKYLGRTRSVPNRPKIPSLRIHRLALGHPVRPKFSHEFPRASCFERKFAIECVVRSLAGLSRLLLYPPADPFRGTLSATPTLLSIPKIRLPPALAGNFRANTYGTRSPTATSTCANVRARATLTTV